jgi:hypothetical protein
VATLPLTAEAFVEDFDGCEDVLACHRCSSTDKDQIRECSLTGKIRTMTCPIDSETATDGKLSCAKTVVTGSESCWRVGKLLFDCMGYNANMNCCVQMLIIPAPNTSAATERKRTSTPSLSVFSSFVYCSVYSPMFGFGATDPCSPLCSTNEKSVAHGALPTPTTWREGLKWPVGRKSRLSRGIPILKLCEALPACLKRYIPLARGRYPNCLWKVPHVSYIVRETPETRHGPWLHAVTKGS